MQPEKEWEKLRKKHKKLPDWKWISHNFYVKTDEGELLKSVQLAIVEKFDTIAHSSLEPIISGGENYSSYFERRMLTEAEREHLFDIYRQLRALLWESNKIAVDFSEKDFAEWLSTVRLKWDVLRPKLAKVFDKLATSWEKYKKPTEETAYHG